MKKFKTITHLIFLTLLTGLVVISCKKNEEEPIQEPSRMICGSRAGHYVIVNPTEGTDVAEVAPNVKFVGEVSLAYMSKRAILVSPLVGGGSPAIFTCDALTGNNLNQITSENEYYVQHIDGSPVAEKIVFSAKDMVNWNLHIHSINEDGTGHGQMSFQDEGVSCPDKNTNVAAKIVGAYMPSWSPDGTKIAFAAYLRELETNYAHNSIIVMSSDGNGKTVVYDVPNKEEIHYDDICWTRDGEFLVFSMAEGSRRAVRALHYSSGTVTNLHNFMNVNNVDVQDHWTSPTQDVIVYMLVSPGGSDLYTIGYEVEGENLKISAGQSRLTDEMAVGHGYTEPDWQHWDLQ